MSGVTLVYRLWLLIKQEPGIDRASIVRRNADVRPEQITWALNDMRKRKELAISGHYHNRSYRCVAGKTKTKEGRGRAPGSAIGRAMGPKSPALQKWVQGVRVAASRRNMAPPVVQRVPHPATELERCWGWVPKRDSPSVDGNA